MWIVPFPNRVRMVGHPEVIAGKRAPKPSPATSMGCDQALRTALTVGAPLELSPIVPPGVMVHDSLTFLVPLWLPTSAHVTPIILVP